MKRTTRIILLLLLVLLVGVQTVSAELADEDVADAIEIIRLINEYRAGQGLNPYTFNQALAVTAQLHSEYQAENNVSTHVGADGSSSTDRARAQGYNGDVSYFRTDEMIYNGSFATPQTAFTWWKGSPIHNGIMTSDVYHEVGVGIAHSAEGRIYYTVNVGMVPNVTSPGSMGYRAPSSDEYKVGAIESIPIVTVSAGADGSIYHTFKEGETMEAIAEAYDVSLPVLWAINNLSEGETPAVGTLMIIQLPTTTSATATSPPQPTTTQPPASTAGEATLPVPTEPGEAVSTTAPSPTSPVLTGDPGSGRSLLWLWIFLGVLLLAVLGFGLYWYLPKLRQTAREEGYDLEGWLMDDLRKEEAPDEEHLHDHDTTTREFDHLPRKSQAILLQDAAKQALADYPIQVENIELLRYVLNAEFVVTGRPDGMPGEVRKYVLRVNAPNFHNRAEIASELDWLDAIKKETRLSVPVPVKTRKGGWVTTVDHPGLGIWRHCVLFEFLPAAASAEEAITPNRIEFLGALIGLLHKHSASFTPPPGFVRKHWDLEGMRGEILDVPITQAYADLTSEERKVLKDAQEIVAEAMDRLGTGQRVYGLIHGDLHLKSMLFSPSGSPVVIDFDTCGYGYYIYDLAVAVWDIFDRDDFTVLRDALLGGYRKVRPLSDLEETFMIHFVAGRLMIQILTWAPRRTDPNLEAVAEKAIAGQVKQLKALLRILKG